MASTALPPPADPVTDRPASVGSRMLSSTAPSGLEIRVSVRCYLSTGQCAREAPAPSRCACGIPCGAVAGGDDRARQGRSRGSGLAQPAHLPDYLVSGSQDRPNSGPPGQRKPSRETIRLLVKLVHQLSVIRTVELGRISSFTAPWIASTVSFMSISTQCSVLLSCSMRSSTGRPVNPDSLRFSADWELTPQI